VAEVVVMAMEGLLPGGRMGWSGVWQGWERNILGHCVGCFRGRWDGWLIRVRLTLLDDVGGDDWAMFVRGG
jgi:hypothetical protein